MLNTQENTRGGFLKSKNLNTDDDLIKFTSPKSNKHSNVIDNENSVLDENNEIDLTVENDRLNVTNSVAFGNFRNDSIVTSFLDSTVIGNAISPSKLGDVILPLGDNSNLKETTPTKSFNESANTTNESNLDIVDFIEVNNDLVNIDQEYLWLCDSKMAFNMKHSKQMKQQQQQSMGKENVKDEAKENISEKEDVTSNRKVKIKNPYKWMTEDLEDKNLDKVKRTLLVALDDISKGFNRRSRSVSTTRTPYYNINGQTQYQLNQFQLAQANHLQQQQYEQQHENSNANFYSTPSTVPVLQQSKSIESILNESTVDVIDSSSNHVEKQFQQGVPTRSGNYSTATITKRRHNLNPNQRFENGSNSNLNENEYYNDVNLQLKLESESSQQYEDITDVQVIAKMQEETLRQSVLNINKITDNRFNNPSLKKQLDGSNQRTGYSTATIVKRTHNNRPSYPLPNNYNDYDNYRRDSASSSDQSSISSTASNNVSPYTSQINVNVGSINSNTIKKSPRKSLDSVNNRSIESKNLNNYQTITKSTSSSAYSNQRVLNFSNASSSLSAKTQLNPASRSTTPSKNTNMLKNESRLPTPRSARGSVDIQLGSNGGNSINKPPPAPTNQAQTGVVLTGRTGRVPMAYGGQRSATTSIVPMIVGGLSSSNQQTSWQQTKINKMQKQQMILQPQQQQHQRTGTQSVRSSSISQQQQHPISSSSSSGTIVTSSTNQNVTISPSSSSSISASSSMNQIAPVNSSSPRSRNTSPSVYSQINNNKICSPSGLLTDGPLGRRPLGNSTQLRERSSSPIYETNVKKNLNFQQQQHIQNSGQLINQLNGGSNSNLQTIQESKIPTSPMVNRKQTRKSFLPQPVQNHQTHQAQRESSASPIRVRSQQQQQRNISPNWNNDCY